ncbi:hypothetical protein OCU04_000408 [Sclerotinia nivalis]|uniref:Uncharacterized protein n=1 Tax=Sclerotinia nivalis TaxID=352851 RepID=A0A9X0DPQ6_9HELO|nr:hypothetical protein OCU04_000408 [Sclerotinia nivalis]
MTAPAFWANLIAACPVPPAPPWISTDSPFYNLASSKRPWWTVQKVVGIAAASAKDISSAMGSTHSSFDRAKVR